MDADKKGQIISRLFYLQFAAFLSHLRFGFGFRFFRRRQRKSETYFNICFHFQCPSLTEKVFFTSLGSCRDSNLSLLLIPFNHLSLHNSSFWSDGGFDLFVLNDNIQWFLFFIGQFVFSDPYFLIFFFPKLSFFWHYLLPSIFLSASRMYLYFSPMVFDLPNSLSSENNLFLPFSPFYVYFYHCTNFYISHFCAFFLFLSLFFFSSFLLFLTLFCFLSLSHTFCQFPLTLSFSSVNFSILHKFSPKLKLSSRQRVRRSWRTNKTKVGSGQNNFKRKPISMENKTWSSPKKF